MKSERLEVVRGSRNVFGDIWVLETLMLNSSRPSWLSKSSALDREHLTERAAQADLVTVGT
jgi:hypothetical protein